MLKVTKLKVTNFHFVKNTIEKERNIKYEYGKTSNE